MSERGPGRENESTTAVTGGSSTTIRGAILIGAAVLLGVVLLGRGIDTSLVPTSDADDGEAGSPSDGDGDGSTSTPETTPDGTPVTRAPSEVTVWVLNAGGPTGTAANGTQATADAGYQTVPAANAPADVAQSIIYYVEGYQADAAAVATLLGFGADRVQALPNPPPVPNGDLQGSNVIAVLGPDFGQQPSG